MRLFQIALPNGRNLLAAGLYGSLLCVWFGTSLATFKCDHAPAWRPGGRAGW